MFLTSELRIRSYIYRSNLPFIQSLNLLDILLVFYLPRIANSAGFRPAKRSQPRYQDLHSAAPVIE
jgi:hypothetical protein